MLAAVARAIFDPSSSSGTEQFEILAADADTEESDAPTDPELGRADYWTCIKCKNQKNNPMYRFCEKCYQVSLVRKQMLYSIDLLFKKENIVNSSRSLYAISSSTSSLLNFNNINPWQRLCSAILSLYFILLFIHSIC